MVWNFITLGIPNIEIYTSSNEMTDQLAKLLKDKLSFHLFVPQLLQTTILTSWNANTWNSKVLYYKKKMSPVEKKKLENIKFPLKSIIHVSDETKTSEGLNNFNFAIYDDVTWKPATFYVLILMGVA